MKKVREIECGWCHAKFTTDDARVKYCCPECYEEAHRGQARKRFKVRYYVTHREQELQRQRKRYRDNPEREKQRATAWAQENIERRREHARNWARAHKEAAQ